MSRPRTRPAPVSTKPPRPPAEPRPRAAPELVDPLASFRPPVHEWFTTSFAGPTLAQRRGWPAILRGDSTLLLAPTGSGKTLAAFLAAIDRLMFDPEPAKRERCRVLYVSPLKALAVDVERNLRAPIVGIAAVAERRGAVHRVPAVAVRSGDTPASERARIGRAPPDILITTPESLYLLLTSEAREILRSVETVIIDEIHSLVPTKRGAHLFLSLERLERLREGSAAGRPLQRIGLSATQRPLEEVARLLGGGVCDEEGRWQRRPVEIVDAGERKSWLLRVEVPVEDMARLGEIEELPSGPAASGGARRSIWPSIHPRLVELIRSHRSTMIFANSRRLAERLATALNDLAGEEIALAHHGSVARDRRQEIEDRLKSGALPAIVATSSLELGLDMGAVDLVIQIEAPPSVASGIQRIGRAGHSVGATSEGVIFPKYRGDLLACAAATQKMREGVVEETLYPRNPLDVLAQQIVAMVSIEPIDEKELFQRVRGAAPFADLPRSSFEGVLDMLSGRYPSDEFAELRPRLTWDRVGGQIRGRQGSRRLAVVSGGTIPDRGLYGVYLAGESDGKKSRRVGELDEEMVFESRPGDVFLLGASSWRINEITHDRVLVTPAPGEPGKMPFWHGDRPGRPVEFGRAIGELCRQLAKEDPERARARLRDVHGLDDRAAQNLLVYLEEQARATGEIPSDRTLVIERTRDEIGDWRVCILSPLGARVHAPWANAVQAMWGQEGDARLEAIWSDDGIAFRIPECESPPDAAAFLPAPDEVEDLVLRGLGQTSLFAARFRENATRALLLPRRFPGHRSPLWAQRKRAADLLAVASRYGTFPLILETYRECLREIFDLPALVDILRLIASRRIRVVTVDSRVPSPFAASLLFSYVANFIYDGDAPLAERRAQALSVDPAQLRELLGEAELRELLDADALMELERTLQRLDKFQAKGADGVHDLLLSIGDLSREEIALRAESPGSVNAWVDELLAERRAIEITLGGERRVAAAEDTARLRDALGIVPPRGLPAAFLEPVADALGDLCGRYARTHAPFLATSLAARLGIGVAPVRSTLERLAAREKVVEGEFTPGGRAREWCDAEVLRSLKRRSLAKLRKEIEPVEHAALGRFLVQWHRIDRPQQGLAALLGAIEQLQGAPIPASVLEADVLPARIRGYRPADLDLLCAASEVVWAGIEPLGPRDGRVALYLVDQLPLIAPPARVAEGELCGRVRDLLAARGALFFADLIAETGAFPADLLRAVWDLVWAGEVSNDTITPLRGYLRGYGTNDSKRRERPRQSFRSRRVGPPGSEGRWSLILRLGRRVPTETERRAALTRVLLERYGVLTREAVHAEGVIGGFSAVYDVLKAMEETGRIRRGYFVGGLGATQFALPGADDRLRAARDPDEEPQSVVLAATDPAQPYGAALAWPEPRNGAAEAKDGPSAAKNGAAEAKNGSATVNDGLSGGRTNLAALPSSRPDAPAGRPQRAAGARVILVDGALVGYLRRGGKSLVTFLPEREPERGRAAKALVGALNKHVDERHKRVILLAEIDGEPPWRSPLAAALTEAGFTVTSGGMWKRSSAAPGHEEPVHARR